MRWNLCKAAAVAALLLAAPAVRANDIILQWYESRWETIDKKMPDAFVNGYTAFWFPPASKADSGGFSVGYDVYDRFNLGSPFDQTLYGTESSVRSLVRNAHTAGLRVYFDYVPNHNGFRDGSTPGFHAAGGYPGFVLTLPGDVDGDFHGAYEGGDLNGRLAGLIDIAQDKNHQFIRHPVTAGAQNIPNQSPNPLNARYYPDQALAANSLGIHPFNLANPAAGDPTLENATGLLLRNAQWMLESVGADGFRIDAQKHVPTWFFSNFYDNTVWQRGRPDLAGNPTTPFSFGEVFDGNFDLLGSYIRKDGFGNRDVLDFPLYFKMNDSLASSGFGDMRQLEYSSIDASDGNANDGSRGVQFAQSHDKPGAGWLNVAYAHVLTRPGYPIVYFNAKEFGSGRSFPQDGRGDALGGDFGDIITRMVDASRRYAKGAHRTRWIDQNTYVHERSNSLLVGLSNRGDAGYDSRTVDTDFRNVTLVEVSGTAADPVVNANGDIFSSVVVGSDGKATIRIPRNKTNSNTHGRGYVMYGLATPVQTQTVSPVTMTLAAETTAVANGVRRMTPMQVITGTTFSVAVQTSPAVAEDNALVRLDGGVPIDANAGLFLTGGEFAGFEQFTGSASPRSGGGSGAYQLTVSTTGLAEGPHYLETIAFTPRAPGSPAAYGSKRSVLYLDRTPPPVTLTYPGTTGTSDVLSKTYTVVARCPDGTADSMHVFFDQSAGYNFLGNVSGANKMQKVDRDEFRFDWNNITSGTHNITIVAFEPTGNSSVTRFEPVGAAVPEPDMSLGMDQNPSSSAVDFQPLPTNITDRAYPNEIVVRVSNVGRSFPADYDVWLDVDGVTLTAQPYNASLLPPVGRLVQNDQNLADTWDEFRFVWRGYGYGPHSFKARAKLKLGGLPENSVSSLVTVPSTVLGPQCIISSPLPGTVLNAPANLAVSVNTDTTARSVQAFVVTPAGQQLIAAVNDPPSVSVALQRAVDSFTRSDSFTGIALPNGDYTIRAIAATGLDGTGIPREAQTTVSVTGYPAEPPPPAVPAIDGNITEFFNRAPLAVSAADGAGLNPAVADFGADGSLTEFHARVAGNTLYLAVRGDMFMGGDPNNNCTILYIDTDSTGGTGMKRSATPFDLSDIADAQRQKVSRSSFILSPALVTQGVGFDAAVIVDGTSPLTWKAYGFGSGGVAGSASSFAELQASLAFGSGFQSSPGAAGTSIAAPSGFEVAIPLTQLGNANPRSMAFAVVTTSDGLFPSPNTLPENAQNTFDPTQTLDGVARFPSYPVRINEVANGATDWVEFVNPGASPFSLNQWTLRWADANGYQGFLPLAGLSIPANGYAVAHDQNPSPAAGSLLLGSNIPWDPARAGSAALMDPYGLAQDYAKWDAVTPQGMPDTPPPGTAFSGLAGGFNGVTNPQRTLSRNAASADTDTAADWNVWPPSPASVNSSVPAGISVWEIF